MIPTRRALPNLVGFRATGHLKQDSIVEVGQMPGYGDLPVLLQPIARGVDLNAWATTHLGYLESLVLKHGGLLLRGFEINELSEFETFVKTVSGEPLSYVEQTSPRGRLRGNIYSSTEYPPQHRIFLHNENSYASTWPLKIAFHCVTPAETGGETPIADVRRVYGRIPAAIRDRFIQQGWMLVRNFGTGFGLSWQTAFQTSGPAEVDRYCAANGIERQWLSKDRLRMRKRRPAVTVHPVTGEALWFNHLTFFHISTLAEEVRRQLLSELGEEDLPYNSYYGDGSPIEPEVLDALRRAYEEEMIAFAWQRRDILMLDNMLVAHGRSAFTGSRKIAVGMAQPYSG